MIQRFVVTVPFLFSATPAGTPRRLDVRNHGRHLWVESDFPIDIRINGRRTVPAHCHRFHLHSDEPIDFLDVSLAIGWGGDGTTVAQIARRHGWCLIHVSDENVEPVPITPWSCGYLDWNFHIDPLNAGAADDVTQLTMIPTDWQRNGRFPDLLWLHAVSAYTHDADETPVAHEITKVTLQKIPVPPVALLGDATLYEFVNMGPAANGRFWHGFAHPLKLPVASLLTSHGAVGGDATPQLTLTAWHAFSAPAATQVTVHFHTSGVMF